VPGAEGTEYPAATTRSASSAVREAQGVSQRVKGLWRSHTGQQSLPHQRPLFTTKIASTRELRLLAQAPAIRHGRLEKLTIDIVHLPAVLTTK